jgi:hypothetical protein
VNNRRLPVKFSAETDNKRNYRVGVKYFGATITNLETIRSPEIVPTNFRLTDYLLR